NVSRHTSTNTGRAPQYCTLLAVAMYEWLTVTTSSPGPTHAASSARCSAAVPDETTHACGAPKNSPSSRSNAATSGPCSTQPERITSAAASASSAASSGRAIGSGLSAGDSLGGAPLGAD